MKPKIELRKAKESKSLSEETPAYTAEVWVDGTHFCDVSNHGQGGPDMQHPPRASAPGRQAAFHQALQDLNARIKATYPPHTFEAGGKTHSLDVDLELICHELLGEMQVERDLRRLLKRTVAFVDPSKKGLRSYKGRYEGPQRAHLITETLRKVPDAKILNNLPFDEALALYKAVA